MTPLSNVPATDLFTGYHRNPLPLTQEDVLAWNAEASCSSGESIDQVSPIAVAVSDRDIATDSSSSHCPDRCALRRTGPMVTTSRRKCSGVRVLGPESIWKIQTLIL